MMEVVRLVLLVAVLGALCPPGTDGSDPDYLVVDRLLKRARGGFRGCGQTLITALNLACDKFAKRSHVNGYITDGEERSEEEPGAWEGGLGRMWLSRSHAVGMFNRVRRGVVNECCEKECSIDELRSYCLVPASNDK